MTLTRKVICVVISGAALGAAAPAFADRGHAYGYDAQYGRNQHERVIVVQRPYYVAPRHASVYYYAPPRVYYHRQAPVFYEQPEYYEQPVYAPTPVVYAPAPVYRVPSPGLGTVVGAVAGAMIGNQIGHGSGRVASTAIGAVIGGSIGSNY